MESPVYVLAGPTASGKSAAAVALALNHEMEIISVDSRQLFQGMTIGSAAPTEEEQRLVRHHLVAVQPVTEPMTAGRFGDLARAAMADIRSRGKRPLLCGGSGMYLRAALGGFDLRLPSDPEVRKRLESECRETGSEKLYHRLRTIDPGSAENISPRDAVRIVRALELHACTGELPSGLRQRGKSLEMDSRCVVLWWDPEALETRIRERVRSMIRQGLEQEVADLLEQGASPDMPPMKSMGYAETLALMRGELSREEWEEAIVVSSRQYAKRQRTWFRSWPDRVDLQVEDSHTPSAVAEQTAVGLGLV